MTTTPAPELTRAARPGRAEPGAPALAGDQIAPPPKMRRRPALVALSVVLVCVGGLASAFAFQSMSDNQSVLTVRETVQRGQVIEADDLVAVQIGLDPAIRAVAADDADAIVGKRAALDIVAGGVITAEQVTDVSIPSEGQSVVGVSLTAAMLPADQVRTGDKVRVVPTGTVEAGATGPAAPVDAVVVGVTVDQVTGNTLVNVQVGSDVAPQVAAGSAAGSVAVVLDSQEG